MSQGSLTISNQSFPSFRSSLNSALQAINTSQSGTSLPSGAVAGTIWLDTTSATTPTLKYYDGTDNISLATIDHVGNTVNWLDSTVSITGLSTSATGTVLTLSDTVNTTTVNLIIDNQKEVRFRELTSNGTNYIGLKAPASLSADLTFTLPSADGTSGQALVTNGSGVLSFTTISAGTSWQSVQTSGFTAVSGRGYPCNTTSSAFTVTLPASATAGDYIQIVDYAGTFGTNKITLNPNGLKIEGSTDNKLLTTNREAVTCTYVDATQGWVSTSGANEGSQSLDPNTYSVDFLVIAGGGAGSPTDGGGGGAGGFRTSTQTVTIGTAITITVGDGGASATSGSNSSISGSGLTTITSAGGGRGGSASPAVAGSSGGSGGGAGSSTAAGTGNTPSTSPSQGNSGGSGHSTGGVGSAGGGGGGAGAVGGNGTTPNVGGNGGAGTASSITGSSVTRSGGGGGAGGYSPTPGSLGTGGTGGGGAAGGGGTTATAGTVNTGGGGGAFRDGSPNVGGAGGKGVIILSVPTSNYSSTTTGSPTVTTSGANTILSFTGSGSYTA